MVGTAPPTGGAGAGRFRSLARAVNKRVKAAVSTPPSAGPWPSVRALHLSVLDGRTLNACVALPPVLGARTATLQLHNGGRTAQMPMTVEGTEKQRRARVTVLLHPAGGAAAPPTAGFALAPGEWRLSVTVSDGDGTRHTADVEAPRAPADSGPVVSDPPCPLTGARFCFECSPDGLAVLRVTAPVPRAEVSGLRLGWDGITVTGRLVGGGPVRVAAEAVCRSSGTMHLRPLTVTGGEFSFDLPLTRMARESREERIWDLRLTGADGSKLKVGRHLHDVRDPKQTFHMPYRLVVTPEGETVRVHLYYTPTGNLALSCSPLGTG